MMQENIASRLQALPGGFGRNKPPATKNGRQKVVVFFHFGYARLMDQMTKNTDIEPIRLQEIKSERELLERILQMAGAEFRDAVDPSDLDSFLAVVRAFSETDPVLQSRFKWLAGFIGKPSQE